MGALNQNGHPMLLFIRNSLLKSEVGDVERRRIFFSIDAVVLGTALVIDKRKSSVLGQDTKQTF